MMPCEKPVERADHLIEWLRSDTVKEGTILGKDGPLATYFAQKFLYWLEALSLFGNMSGGIRSIIDLDKAIEVRDTISPCLLTIY